MNQHVDRLFAQALEIADKISGYSYQRGGHVFLEEDCDFHTFHQAKAQLGHRVILENRHTNRTSRIRSYDRYCFV
jgi:hypothetical protein